MATARRKFAAFCSTTFNSPFGVALVGNDLYAANTDAIVRYPYAAGDTKNTAPGTTLTPLPGGPIDHHWTKSPVAGADGSLLYVGVGSNSNIGENGIEAERDRAAILEVDRATGRSRIFASACAIPTGSVWSRRPARCGRSSTSATNWDPIWCRII
jgi:glucose/arabinose dehydrogenase